MSGKTHQTNIPANSMCKSIEIQSDKTIHTILTICAIYII